MRSSDNSARAWASSRRHSEYRLVFRANSDGIAKAMEFHSRTVVQALRYAIDDAARRRVEIWEDGEFVCVIGGNPFEIALELPRTIEPG